MRKFFARLASSIKHAGEGRGIHVTIVLSFSLVAGISMIVLGFLFYSQVSRWEERRSVEREEQFLNQTRRTLEDHLHNMRRTSDAMYFIGIKNTDMSQEDINDEINLLYESDKDNLVSIALYSSEGELITACPVSTVKPMARVREQDWFVKAYEQVENLHFSTPHVQDLFDENVGQYHWVISVSRAVEIDRAGFPTSGVLLVDMNFDSLSLILSKANSDSLSGYIYVCDSDGNIIFHPRQKLLNSGFYDEDSIRVASRADGSYTDTFRGERRITVQKTVSYTGWKLVSVIPSGSLQLGFNNMMYLAILMISLSILGVLLVNLFVTNRVTYPILKLEESVQDIEAGNLNPDISYQGPREVSHLARSLDASVERIRQLMDDLVSEQEEKRKSELDALQSQINPHFLYNALDSVIWLIEGERDRDAVYTVKELANLMRVSISHGRTVIPVRDEIRHAQSYMNIQNIRYRNSFDVEFDIAEEIMDSCTVKLIIQPLLENAIYYGIQGMEDDGCIDVRGWREGDEVYIDVSDNGMGMPAEQVKTLLDPVESQEYKKEHETPGMRHGNGVGLINVDMRIRLMFGDNYGLTVISEPDEGTTMRIHLPFMEYSDDIEKRLKR